MRNREPRRPIGSKDDFPLVMVEWVDSASMSSGWNELEDLRRCGTLRLVTAGFLVHETPEHVVICASVRGKHRDNEHASDRAHGDISIPKCAIVARKVIRA